MSSHVSAIEQAYNLQKDAAHKGFDWEDIYPILDKVEEELLEVREAIESGNKEHIAEEIGDLIFVCINLAIKSGLNPDDVLNLANSKFERRFSYIEQKLKTMKKEINKQSIAKLESLWQDAKKEEIK